MDINLVNTGIYTHLFNVPLLGWVSFRVRYDDNNGQMSLYMRVDRGGPEHRVMTEYNNGSEEEARDMMRKYEEEILHEGLNKILGR